MFPDSFEAFIQDRVYLKNVSEKTVRSYRQAHRHWRLSRAEPNRGGLNQFVVYLRKKGLSPGACNVYIRSINSWLSWGCEEGLIPKLKISQLKEEKKELRVLNREELFKILRMKPVGFFYTRTFVLASTLIDTGCRIEELLTLKESEVDLDNLLLSVIGKGRKERKVPISLELRKTLFRYWKMKHKLDIDGYVFCTRRGKRLSYRNAYRDILKFCESLGVKDVSPHTFRHTFATHFLAEGGSPFHLRRILGHQNLQTTMRYVHLQTEDLKSAHRSILACKL